MKENGNDIKKIVNETLRELNLLSDANTVVGTPVSTESGVTIIPVTKTTIAYLSGGGEYGQVKIFDKSKNYPLSTGSGGIVNVKPCGFLIENKGRVKYVSCPDGYLEKLCDDVVKLLDGEK